MRAKPRSGQVSRDERRHSLLDAARVLFAEKGYHDTTVDDITRAADVAKGTFYLYFQEKREIYHEVIRSFLEQIKEVGNLARVPLAAPSEFVRRVQEVARHLMALLKDNTQLARMAYRESMGLDPKLGELLHGFYREIALVEARNIELAMGLGIVRPCPPLLTAYVHIGMIERVLLELLERPDDFPPLEQVVEELLRQAFEGIKGPMAPPWQALR